jgi:hypothetical protein
MSTTRKDDDSDDTGFETSSELTHDFGPRYGPPRPAKKRFPWWFALGAVLVLLTVVLVVLLIIHLLTR